MDSANAASAPSPSKSSSLPTRIVSAIIPLPAILLVAWLGDLPVILACTTVVFLALRELYTMLGVAGYRPRVFVGFGCALLIVGAAVLRSIGGPDLSGFALALALLLSLIAELAAVHDRELMLPIWALTFTGALYVSWLVSHLILMRALTTPLHQALLGGLQIEPGAAWIYTALAITWANDTAAYLIGRALGRHRMSPYISPKKSWEGAVGGVTGAVGAALLSVPLFGIPVSFAAAALLGLAGGVAGILGDLAESLIKRQAGVKDSGTLLPGHGGLLDRIDSLIFVVPTLYYLILLLAR